MPESIKLSVVIITFNEEKNIARCLDSVKEVADDVVVVDSFSTDKTEEICKEKGARFVQHKFEGHIQQKNWAITQAKYPQILSLDADEALSNELKKSIQQVKGNWSFDSYSMNRLTNYCGQWIRHTSWYPDKKLRLWDSGKGKWAGVNPHDEFQMTDAVSKVGHLKGDILHYSYYAVEEHLKQIDSFTEIGAKALFDIGIKASFAKRFLSPVAAFIKNYFLTLGFLEGKNGFIISKYAARTTFLKYKKLQQLNANRS